MSHKRTMQNAGIGLTALLMAMAPGMDRAVQAKLRLDAADVGGCLYQPVADDGIDVNRATHAGAPDFATLWLVKRTLYCKPAHTGVGEYLLCAFQNWMLIATVMRAPAIMRMLYANLFLFTQLPSNLAGIFLLFLCALPRTMRGEKRKQPCCRMHTKPKRWIRYPCRMPRQRLACNQHRPWTHNGGKVTRRARIGRAQCKAHFTEYLSGSTVATLPRGCSGNTPSF